MIVLFVILLCLSVYGVSIGKYDESYMSKESSNAVKGIFAVIILYSHMRSYLCLPDHWANNSYVAILNYIGQLMVAPYLFYSGYGLMESLKHKPNYRDTFLEKRWLRLLLHFDIAVVLYILVQSFWGVYFSPAFYIGSLLGWCSVGNSNWFVFDILVIYLFFYALISLSNRQGVILFGCTILCCILWIFLSKSKTGSWWVDTLMTFPLGIAYSIYRKRFENLLRIFYYGLLVLLTILLTVWHWKFGVDRYGLCSCVFCLWLVVLTMRVRIDNRILQWLGIHAFGIYILQRLPMMVLSHYDFNRSIVLFVMTTIVATFLLAKMYHQFTQR